MTASRASSDETRTDNLESPRTLKKHRREWLFERVGWLAYLVTIVAALLGVLGRGAFSARTLDIGSANAVVEYQAIDRCEAPSEFRFDIRSPSASGPLRIALSRAFVNELSHAKWTPPPVAVESDGDTIVYQFLMPASEAMQLVFRHQHQNWGRRECEIQIGEGPPVRLSQLIFP